MGKVLSTFVNTFPGAISRNVDDAVISLPNTGTNAIAFGAPVFLDATNGGAVGFADATTKTMATFLGFATRIGVKTPDTYGGNLGQYNAGDVMSIIVRGSVCVALAGATAAAIGGAVYMDATTGAITAVSTSNTELTNCKFRGAKAANNCVEVVLTERNIQ